MRPVTVLLAMTLAVAVAALVVGTAFRAGAQDGKPNAFAQWKQGPPSDPSYFPIAVWCQGPQNALRYKAAGINLYVALWDGPTDQQLADLTKAGMPVICGQTKVGLAHINDPIIVGWMHGDEPDNAQPMKDPATGKDTWGPCIPPQKIVDEYNQMRAADPSRPVMLNLGQGVAWDQWYGRGNGAQLSDYETYVKGADIVSFDVYPVASTDWKDGAERLWLVPKGVDRLVKWTEGRRIVWNALECTRISGQGQATPEQVKAEVWMSLIHGSTGLIYFVHQFQPKFDEWALLDDPVMLPAVTAINQQIHDLAPALNSPTVADGVQVTSSSPNVPIDAMAKRLGNTTYVFAVGMRNAPAKASFTVRDLPAATKAEAIGEGRSVGVTNGQFTDDFAAYSVHLYRIRG
jgi:hypothetical protein